MPLVSSKYLFGTTYRDLPPIFALEDFPDKGPARGRRRSKRNTHNAPNPHATPASCGCEPGWARARPRRRNRRCGADLGGARPRALQRPTAPVAARAQPSVHGTAALGCGDRQHAGLRLRPPATPQAARDERRAHNHHLLPDVVDLASSRTMGSKVRRRDLGCVVVRYFESILRINSIATRCPTSRGHGRRTRRQPDNP